MNRAELRRRILEALNESADNPSFWTTGEINSVIDEGAEILAEEVSLVKKTASVPLRPGTNYYYTQSIAPNIMVPYRLWYQSRDRRLYPWTMGDLDRRHIQWLSVSGEPWVWFPVCWNLFGIWPRPTMPGGVLRVDYIGWPTPLIDDVDEPEMLDSDQDQMVLYGVYDGLLKQWDVQRAVQTFGLFVEKLPQTNLRGTGSLRASDLQRAQDSMREGHIDRIVPN